MLSILMGVTFFKAFHDITYITKWFKEIVYNNKTTILMELRIPKRAMDSKTSNLSYFNIRFFFKAFPDISQNGLKKLFTIIKRQF